MIDPRRSQINTIVSAPGLQVGPVCPGGTYCTFYLSKDSEVVLVDTDRARGTYIAGFRSRSRPADGVP
jgi:hypothetical protein